MGNVELRDLSRFPPLLDLHDLGDQTSTRPELETGVLPRLNEPAQSPRLSVSLRIG